MSSGIGVWKEQKDSHGIRHYDSANFSIGWLVANPKTRTTGKDNTLTTAQLAVSMPCHAAQNGEATFWLAVVAFGKQSDALAKHQKGNMISVAGNMQLSQWKGQDAPQNEAN